MTTDAGGAARQAPPRRLGDSIFATICTASGAVILLTLAGVAIFLTYEGVPGLHRQPRTRSPAATASSPTSGRWSSAPCSPPRSLC